MNENKDFFILALLVLAVSLGGGVVMSKLKSRGIRLNNPSNLRHGVKWQGMSADQPDKDFVKFLTPEHGLRAMYKNLMTYRTKHKLDTIGGIISRWAPPNENNTKAYIDFVSKRMGISPTAKLSLAMYPELMRAIITMENGEQPYTNQQINAGISLA
jgi:hypothetical protein